MARKYKKYRLTKDVVIPAGTELEEIPYGATTKYYEGNASAIIGMTKDSAATFVVNTDSGMLEEITDGN